MLARPAAMSKLVACLVLSISSIAVAQTPKLLPVETGSLPLKLSAPDGWEVNLEPPRDEGEGTIGRVTPNCAGADQRFVIQMYKSLSPAKALANVYRDKKPTKVHGWDCVTVESSTEVMCAGKVKGSASTFSVYFATTDAKSFKAFGDPTELASQIGASMTWKGKSSDLVGWRRESTDAAKAVCK